MPGGKKRHEPRAASQSSEVLCGRNGAKSGRVAKAVAEQETTRIFSVTALEARLRNQQPTQGHYLKCEGGRNARVAGRGTSGCGPFTEPPRTRPQADAAATISEGKGREKANQRVGSPGKYPNSKRGARNKPPPVQVGRVMEVGFGNRRSLKAFSRRSRPQGNIPGDTGAQAIEELTILHSGQQQN